MKSKIGGERIMSIWWFFIFAIILIAVVAAVLMYYAQSIDVRRLEADILANKIIDCSIKNGEITPEIITGNYDFYDKCGLVKNTIDTDYYFEIKIVDFDSGNEEKKIEKGKLDYPAYCKVQEENGRQAKLPQCQEKFVYTNYQGKAKLFFITTISNHKSGEIWKS